MPTKDTQPRFLRRPRIWRRRLALGAAASVVAVAVHSLLGLAAPKSQIAVFRPSSAEWLVRAEDQSMAKVPFGTTGDVPVARDYEGRGQADIAVFRPSTQQWLIRATTGTLTITL